MTYIPGDYWMICQRTGIKFRRSEMRSEPVLGQEGFLWVHKSALNPPHPQDFVKALPEDTSVYPALPSVVQSVGETTLLDDLDKNSKINFVVARTGLAEKDPIGVQLNNSIIFWNFIDVLEVLTGAPLRDSNGDLVRDVNGDTVTTADGYSGYLATLYDPIPYAADAGNTVYLPSLNNEDWK